MFERIETIVDGINGREGAEDRRPNTPKDIWEAIRMLERGPRPAKNLAPMALQKDQPGAADGALCETPTETAEAMVKSLAKTFSQTGTFDQDAVDSVPQRPLQPHLDRPFTEYECTMAIHKARTGASGAPRSSTRSTRRSTKTQTQRGTSGG